VAEEMVLEKEQLIADERKRLKAENDRNLENSLLAEDIVLQNKLVMEAKQRMEFEARQVADSQRLHEIQRKVASLQPMFCRPNRDKGKRSCSQRVRLEKKRKKTSSSQGACRSVCMADTNSSLFRLRCRSSATRDGQCDAVPEERR
jgi:hypothetical protein